MQWAYIYKEQLNVIADSNSDFLLGVRLSLQIIIASPVDNSLFDVE